MGQITKGLTKIEMGAIANDDGPGTDLTVLGLTKRDSVSITEEDPTLSEIFAEEVALAVFSDSIPGATTFKWTLLDPTLDALQKVFGGTITGAKPNRIWNRPAASINLIQTVKVTPKVGYKAFTIPKAAITAKFSGTFGQGDAFTVELSAKVLQSTKADVGPIVIAE